MSFNSINTNVGAMQALQALAGTNAELATVQQRITTGLKVSSPKDNPAIWATAQNQRAEVESLMRSPVHFSGGCPPSALR